MMRSFGRSSTGSILLVTLLVCWLVLLGVRWAVEILTRPAVNLIRAESST